jgi:hypothetical protein
MASHSGLLEPAPSPGNRRSQSTHTWLLLLSQKMQHAVQTDGIGAICFKALRKQEMQSVRAASKWTVRCHLSSLVSSHGKEMARGRAAGRRRVLRPERQSDDRALRTKREMKFIDVG